MVDKINSIPNNTHLKQLFIQNLHSIILYIMFEVYNQMMSNLSPQSLPVETQESVSEPTVKKNYKRNYLKFSKDFKSKVIHYVL